MIGEVAGQQLTRKPRFCVVGIVQDAITVVEAPEYIAAEQMNHI